MRTERAMATEQVMLVVEEVMPSQGGVSGEGEGAPADGLRTVIERSNALSSFILEVSSTYP